MALRLPRPVQPLGRKLPLLISALLAGVLVALGWTAYRRMEHALLAAATDRLTSAADRFGLLLSGSVRGSAASARILAGRPALRDALARPTPTGLAEARQLLEPPPSPDSTPAFVRVLWTADCSRMVLATVPRPSGLAARCPGVSAAVRAGAAELSSFVVEGTVTRYTLSVPVTGPDSAPVGLLVEARSFAQASGVGNIAGLIGRQVEIRVGNRDGTAWSDMLRVRGGPPPTIARDRLASYNDQRGQAQIGVARDVAGTPWTAWVQMPQDAALAPARRLLWEIALAGLACVILGAIGAWLVGRHVAEPIEEIARAAESLASGDYSRRVAAERRDELGVLAEAFNGMAARIHAANQDLQQQYLEATALATELELANQELIESMVEATEARKESAEARSELLQVQKMEAVGRLAGGIAHDFNNLLTVITSYSGLALESLPPDSTLRDDMIEIRAAADRAAGLTRQLLAFSRKQVMQPRVVNLNELAHDMERMLRRLIGEDVELVLSLTDDVGLVHADPGQLQQVLLNLAVNARDAMPNGGRLTIETADRTLSRELSLGALGASAGEYVTLTVSDTGSGMTTEVQAHLFEPFFTTKPPGMGTGLGLSTVYGIVKQSEGDIHVDSAPGRGTTVRIYLPRYHDAGYATAVAAPEGALATAAFETVLLLEDNDALRTLVRRILERAGYRVLEVRTPDEALRTSSAHAGTIHLLLTDVVMPGLNGREVAERLLADRPGLRVLYMSGYTDDEIMRRGIVASETRFLEKPFGAEQLVHAVRDALDDRAAPATPA